MLIRIYKLTCDFCKDVVEQDTNRFPTGWKHSQILLNPVEHICPECLGKGVASERNWKNGGEVGSKQKANKKTSRGEASLKPMKLSKKQGYQINKSVEEGTARPKIAIKPVKPQKPSRIMNGLKAAGGTIKRACAPIQEDTPLYWIPPTPSRDDPKWHETGGHFNVWWFAGIMVAVVVICYSTNTYPWINGVLKF